MDETGTTFRYPTGSQPDELSITKPNFIQPAVLGDRIRDFIQVFDDHQLIPHNNLEDYKVIRKDNAILIATKKELETLSSAE
jgi:hypothetical protein